MLLVKGGRTSYPQSWNSPNDKTITIICKEDGTEIKVQKCIIEWNSAYFKRNLRSGKGDFKVSLAT